MRHLPLLLLFAACEPEDGLDLGDACPGLDCRDQLTLSFTNALGEPTSDFELTLYESRSIVGTLSCPSNTGDLPNATCLEGGAALYVYAESVEILVSDTLVSGAGYAGFITPAWEAPYDSEECGHYCYLAEERVQFEGCMDCE